MCRLRQKERKGRGNSPEKRWWWWKEGTGCTNSTTDKISSSSSSKHAHFLIVSDFSHHHRHHPSDHHDYHYHYRYHPRCTLLTLHFFTALLNSCRLSSAAASMLLLLLQGWLVSVSHACSHHTTHDLMRVFKESNRVCFEECEPSRSVLLPPPPPPAKAYDLALSLPVLQFSLSLVFYTARAFYDDFFGFAPFYCLDRLPARMPVAMLLPGWTLSSSSFWFSSLFLWHCSSAAGVQARYSWHRGFFSLSFCTFPFWCRSLRKITSTHMHTVFAGNLVCRRKRHCC